MKRIGLSTLPLSINRKRCGNSGVCFSADPTSEAAKLREQAQKLRKEAAEAAGVQVEEITPVIKNNDGTVYDDEVEAPRDNLSTSMKDRLRREASTGLDSETSQNNVILYICVAVAILVGVGGQGILY